MQVHLGLLVMTNPPEGYTEIKLFAKDDCEECEGDGLGIVEYDHPVLDILGKHIGPGLCRCVKSVKVENDGKG